MNSHKPEDPINHFALSFGGESLYNQVAGQSLGRLCSLSDGIFGVAMTLLVFDFRPPDLAGIATELDLIRALIRLGWSLILVAMSFLTLGIFWVGQQTQLQFLSRSDRHFVWIHIAFLFLVSLVPFSTRLLIGFTHFRLAIVLYWFNNLFIGLILYASWSYANRAGLLVSDLPAEVNAAIRRRIVLSQLLYAFGVSLSLIHPFWSIGFIVTIQLGYAFGVNLGGRRLLTQIVAEPADTGS